jgi:hypothetical protein
MQQTISENFITNLSDTLSVSCIKGADFDSINFLFLGLVRFNSHFLNNSYMNYSTFNKDSSNNNLDSIAPAVQNFYAIDPFFITGFFDAESSFMLFLDKDPKYKIGWAVKLTFSVVLHKKDIVLLESIKSALSGIGTISNHVNGIQFRVRSKSELEVLIKFLDKFNLISQKQADYLLFKQAFEIYSNKLHLTFGSEGLEKLFEIKAVLNKGTTQNLDNTKLNSPDNNESILNNSVKPIARPLVFDQLIKSSHWLAGFTAGEGGFYVQIQGKKKSLKFYIGQHHRDKALLESFIYYLDCGRVVISKSLIVFVVTKFIDIDEKIIPFFKNYIIHGIKSLDFQDFCEVANLIKAKEHLTLKGLNKIKRIKMRMNRNRTLENNNYDPKKDNSLNIIQNSIISQNREDSSSSTSNVKILLNVNNPQVTKAFNS